jgi:F-type H+-transporting ATPase subunit epsilon
VPFHARNHSPRERPRAEGQVRITQADGSKVIASADDGFLSMENDELTIVAGHASLQS